jgi:hypothetical protein
VFGIIWADIVVSTCSFGGSSHNNSFEVGESGALGIFGITEVSLRFAGLENALG